jgi:hypothetical protein
LPGGCGATNDPSAQALFNAIRTHLADPINGGNARSRATPIRSLPVLQPFPDHQPCHNL